MSTRGENLELLWRGHILQLRRVKASLLMLRSYLTRWSSVHLLFAWSWVWTLETASLCKKHEEGCIHQDLPQILLIMGALCTGTTFLCRPSKGYYNLNTCNIWKGMLIWSFNSKRKYIWKRKVHDVTPTNCLFTR